jgi:hypothetical protein
LTDRTHFESIEQTEVIEYMKKIAFLSVTAMWVAAVVAGVLIAGCETGGDTVALSIDPSFVDLSTVSTNGSVSDTQTFTATGGLRALSLPLAWSVSNPDLGNIAASGGYTASYVRNSTNSGDNSIIVVDQYGAEGVATVRQ